MSELHIRPFGAGDLGPVVALWNRCLPKDQITKERFWHMFLLDPNFDSAGALVAEEVGGGGRAGAPSGAAAAGGGAGGADAGLAATGGRAAGGRAAGGGAIVGFLQVVVRRFPLGTLGLEPGRGYLNVFFVEPQQRRHGVATALLSVAIEYLRGHGCRELRCGGYVPYYVTPGVDVDYVDTHSFLAMNGFTRVAAPVAMGRALERAATPAWVREREAMLSLEGIEVRGFQVEDTLPLLDFVEKHFPDWAPSVRDGLQHENLEIVVATMDDSAVAGGGGATAAGGAPNLEIVGCAQWENTYNDPPRGMPGRFGPFGVRPDLRNRGIGAVIFWNMVQRARARGSRYLWFGWAGGRNVAFYERMGCQVTRSFVLYRKVL